MAANTGIPAAHADEIAAALTKGESQRAIAKRLGIARSSLQHYLTSHNNDGAGVTKLEMLEYELSQLRKVDRQGRKVDVQHELVLDEIRAAITAAPPVYTAPTARKGVGRKHAQALLLSDLHAGEVVVPEAVEHMNEYNWTVLEDRMAAIHRALLAFAEARPYPIDELHIWMLGDMCSGSNHLELMETNEFSAAEQGFKVGMLLGQFVEGLVPHYPSIKVYGVAGNHPRVTQAPQNKNVFNNFDWVAYRIAETYLRNYDSVKCEFPRSGFIVVPIAGKKIVLFHGDGIRSSMPGVPWGGVVRRCSELRKQHAEFGTYLDGFALGHFHQANVVQGNIFMNGSVKGPDEYSIKQFGSSERPTQLLLTFDPAKHRLTDVSYITP